MGTVILSCLPLLPLGHSTVTTRPLYFCLLCPDRPSYPHSLPLPYLSAPDPTLSTPLPCPPSLPPLPLPENSSSLAEALRSVMMSRRDQDNFQLIVITHDERFAQAIGTVCVGHRYSVCRPCVV